MRHYEIRSTSLRLAVTQVEATGRDPAPIMEQAGLPLAALSGPDCYVPYENFVRFLNICAKTLDDPAFGFNMSRRVSMDHIGILALVIQTSQNLGEALENFSRFVALQTRAATLSIVEDGDLVHWQHHIHYAGPESLYQVRTYAMGFGGNILKIATGDNFKPVAMNTIMDKQPADRFSFGFLDCPIHYRAAFNGWTFRREDLLQPLAKADPALQRYLEQEIQTAIGKSGHDFALQIKDLIRRSIAIGNPSIDRIADWFGISRRSLQRKLSESGLLFRDLLEETRLEMARDYLNHSSLPLTDIALLCGFTEQSAFSRFFRQKTGHSPRDWRNDLQIQH